MKFFFLIKKKKRNRQGAYVKENLLAKILVRARSRGQLRPNTFGSNKPANQIGN